MSHLHPPECACGDCRNRRLICGLESAAEGRLANEPKHLGSLLGGEDTSGKSARSHVTTRPRATGVRQIY